MEKLSSFLRKRVYLLEQLANNEQLLSKIEQVAKQIRAALSDKATILICGNGGSAAEAQHMAGELVGRYLVERDGFPALALTADIAVLTAVSNDYGYDEIFARQVKAFKDAASVLIVLSTSGNSKNLQRAVEQAKACGMTTIGLLGRDGGLLGTLCDYSLVVPSWSTPEIQEIHLTLIHLICKYVESQDHD